MTFSENIQVWTPLDWLVLPILAQPELRQRDGGGGADLWHPHRGDLRGLGHHQARGGLDAPAPRGPRKAGQGARRW